MTEARPYSGTVIAFATAHGKDDLAREPFAAILDATVVAPPALDTDQFGTFSGEIPRTLTPQAAAHAKAALAMNAAGTPFALASEGSFSGGFGLLVEHRELLLFVDRQRGLEVIEATTEISPLPPSKAIDSVDGAERYADRIGFPAQGIIVRTASGISKDLRTSDAFRAHIDRSLGENSTVSIEPDLRAHRCPSRADTIARLAQRMAHRLDTPCPTCATPGFGRVNVSRGVRCRDCGSPTELIEADIFGCARCDHTQSVLRPPRRADPARCPECNP